MDDLDHSMHIAEFDWTSFYDESEECGLLQPSLACPDNSSLSDSEDSESSGSVFSTGRQEIQQSPGVDSDGAAGRSTGEEGCVKLWMKLDESGTGGEPAEGGSVTQVDYDCPARSTLSTEHVCMKTTEDITEETKNNIGNTLQTEKIHDQCSGVSTELKKDDKDVQTDTDNPRSEPDPVFPDVNEPQSTDKAVGNVAPRAEKERWFVTVNYSPARQRLRATSVKKKRRQKKVCKHSQAYSHGQEKSPEDGLELEINNDINESETGRDMDLVQDSGGQQIAEINPESASDSVQAFCEEDNVSEKLLISLSSPKESINGPRRDRDKHEPGSSASTSQDTSTPTDPFKPLESADSDEFEDGVESFSVHSYDSEIYLSAAESVEETQPVDLRQLQCSVSLSLQAESSDADSAQVRQMHPCGSALRRDCAGYERTGVESTQTCAPLAGQRADNMPDDLSGCDNNTHSTDTPAAQIHKMNLSASGCSSGDQFSPDPVPDLTVTPVADSPEAYAEAAGHTRPVYAISAFWDEMEKLTINDILQLRTCRSTPLGDTQDKVTANVDESPISHGSLVDTAEYNLSDGGLMDASDTADSDYFTQTDESKPDRSSCEFSTSDFEEDYWQFIGASRNASPDPHSKNPQRTCDSTFSSPEEEESTSSEGRETPVPLEDFAGQCFEDQEARTLSKLQDRQMTKSKSVRDVQALNKEDLTLPFGNEESGSDALDEHYHLCKYFLTEDKAKNDPRFVAAVHDPEDISMAPVLDYTLCTFRDEISLPYLHDSQCRGEKPIPIFSCSHPTVRELAFPKSDNVFMGAACKASAEVEVDLLSPIRVLSCSFIQANKCGAPAGGSRGFGSLLSMRKIRLHDKGSIWHRGSGAWVFPAEAVKTERKDPAVTALSEERVCSASPSRLFRELEVQQSTLETMQTTRREDIFSTLQQSDMCLVCIAFASWVLRSSDPEAADAWKAALLANVSALSAIQYLRQYVKKRSPPREDP
ncbi:uncharacterized protein si:ch211-157b11.14 [Toxotes jaculatrix]|uniref:uncharacterized protein si:ch211-157b11.14 n=1 Tax=Toxotes jaculatrix TaxID=941984 RepID=UPI001B3AA284|nr:uncharacterized protein si:ch211-157b11.14 [Toxotes jaculatrix]